MAGDKAEIRVSIPIPHPQPKVMSVRGALQVQVQKANVRARRALAVMDGHLTQWMETQWTESRIT